MAIKQITNVQMNLVKAYAVEYLRSVKFTDQYCDELVKDFREENDLALDTFGIARYISWHMRHHDIHTNNVDFANVCAFEAVTYGLNEVMVHEVEKALEFPNEFDIPDAEREERKLRYY